MPLYVYRRAVEEEGRRRGDMKVEEEGRRRGNMKLRRSKTMAFERQEWRV